MIGLTTGPEDEMHARSTAVVAAYGIGTGMSIVHEPLTKEVRP